MPDYFRTLPLLAFMALAAPLAAQEDADAGGESAQPGADLSLGESDAGQTYVAATNDAWEVQCVRTEGQEDPCTMYQLLMDPNDNAVAEISLFRLPEGGRAVAGATVVVPLETLLTEQLRISVDAGEAKRYPFSVCTQVGCYARIGFTEADVAAFKRGAAATLSIVPFQAPDQTVSVEMSLSGFTASFDALPAIDN
ncbi:invasion associated locus B family protein [Rhodosalinus sp. 5P4]|uniref:invasion associated locus B family protein n=1 Tax=Rhodosalinus sp. 5P4 TaxID=3239196 RepID=UPI003523BE51